jgi:hypothetical protein
MKKVAVLLFSISLLTACSGKSGASGSIGDRIKGKNLSIQAFYMSPGKSPKERPTINVQNDSDKNFAMMPLTVTAWFKQAGKKERTFNSGELAGAGQIEPQKVVMLPGDLFNFDVAPSDQLDKLTLSIGGGQEVFTINP